MKQKHGYLLLICLTSAMGGLLFGYDWVVIGGAKIFYEPFFNLEGGGTIYNESLSGDIFVEIENCIFENIEGNYKILYNKTNTENDSISVLIKNCSMQNSMGAGDIVKSKSDKGKIKLSFENTSFKKCRIKHKNDGFCKESSRKCWR